MAGGHVQHAVELLGGLLELGFCLGAVGALVVGVQGCGACTGYFAVEAVADAEAVSEAELEGVAEALADALADAAAVLSEVALAEPLAEPLAEAVEEAWDEPQALRPSAAAGSAPMSRARRVKGEVMVFLLRIGAGAHG